MSLKVIAFDADDTLWVNEPYFRETEDKFCALLEDFLPAHTVAKELYRTETQNIPPYGYGVKGAHEQVDHNLTHPNFREAETIKDILPSLLSL